MIDGAGEKATGATSRIEQDFAGVGVDSIGHEGGDGAWRVIFACIPGRLQIVEVDNASSRSLGRLSDRRVAAQREDVAASCAGQ
jgi:hypothetical protein